MMALNSAADTAPASGSTAGRDMITSLLLAFSFDSTRRLGCLYSQSASTAPTLSNTNATEATPDAMAAVTLLRSLSSPSGTDCSDAPMICSMNTARMTTVAANAKAISAAYFPPANSIRANAVMSVATSAIRMVNGILWSTSMVLKCCATLESASETKKRESPSCSL